MPFSSLGFAPRLMPFFLTALAEKGYTTPTPIQLEAIPAILQGRDLLATAQTGSGKTAAFALPLLQQLCEQPPGPSKRRVHSLVLVPTRELAAQVGDVFASLAKHLPHALKIMVLSGGVSINPQMMKLRGGADLVVATPGRLIDLIDHNALSLDAVQSLVLDEADRLLDLGFGEEISQLLALMPARRQNLFFSATFPPDAQALAKRILHDPLQIAVQSAPQAEPDIQQRMIEVDPSRRTQLLRHLVQTEGWKRVLVFVATKHAAEIVADKLRKADINAEPFHGELSQGKRNQVLLDFKAQDVQVVVATDVAARGLDIARLPVVVNYDLPRSPVDYTHRIGRTGRAGETGMAISFVSAATQAHWRLIEKRQKLQVTPEQVTGFEPTKEMEHMHAEEGDARPSAAVQDPHGGIKGKRPSKKDKLREAVAQARLKAGNAGD